MKPEPLNNLNKRVENKTALHNKVFVLQSVVEPFHFHPAPAPASQDGGSGSSTTGITQNVLMQKKILKIFTS